MKPWFLPSLGAFILWGLWSFIPKITTRYISPKSAIIFEVTGGMLVAALVLLSLKFRPDLHPKGMLLAMLTGFLGFGGSLCFLYAVSRGPVTLIAVLTALYPVIAIILSMIFLNESVSVKQGLGIVLGLVSMILICT